MNQDNIGCIGSQPGWRIEIAEDFFAGPAAFMVSVPSTGIGIGHRIVGPRANEIHLMTLGAQELRKPIAIGRGITLSDTIAKWQELDGAGCR